MTREYRIKVVNNGNTLWCPVCGDSVYTEMGDLFDHIEAEEKKFPVDE